MSIEQLIKKKEECMISGLWRKGAFFLSWLAACPLLTFSLSFYILGKPNPFSTK
jgi:Na+-translocating ferredoxin:NAD+ oxidoreductase RnfE subunit